jgi:glycosyltransferase involved in cell wall biosynthesis
MVDATMTDAAPAKLSILHVMRAPVGGLFRHVIDLARAQSERGHRVGIVADSTSGGASADAKLADLTPTLAFGVTRVPMSRQIGASDVAAVRHVAARDLVFIGELRVLKGVDVLLRAVAGSGLSVAIVGDGPDRAVFEADAVTLGLKDKVQFLGAMPARQGFALGRALVIPSRAESLPYIVLEAAAAGMPLIATAVGGMAEIFGPDADKLAEPDDAAALRRAIETTLNDPDAARQHALRLQARVRAAFSADTMTDAVLTAYREALRLQRAADHG